MPVSELPELLATAVEAARAGSAVVERYFRSEHDLQVRLKGAHDLVTRADRESERAVVAAIRARHPEHHVLGEEGGASAGASRGASDHRWVIDPLDGTTNFSYGLPIFAISVACQHRDETVAGVVLDPVSGDLFTGAKGLGARCNDRPMAVARRGGLDGAFLATGYPWRSRGALDLYLGLFRDVFTRARAVRRCGAAALDLAYTAAGIYDGFFEFRLGPWDIAAGELLIREAGGVVSDFDGSDGIYAGGNVVAGAPEVHAELLATARDHLSEARIDELDPRP